MANDLTILVLILGSIMVISLEMPLILLNFLDFNLILKPRMVLVLTQVNFKGKFSQFKAYLSGLWQEWSHCFGLLSSHEFYLSRQTCSSQVSFYGS